MDYLCVHISIYVDGRTNIFIYIFIYLYMYICVYVYICIYVNKRLCAYCMYYLNR